MVGNNSFSCGIGGCSMKIRITNGRIHLSCDAKYMTECHSIPNAKKKEGECIWEYPEESLPFILESFPKFRIYDNLNNLAMHYEKANHKKLETALSRRSLSEQNKSAENWKGKKPTLSDFGIEDIDFNILDYKKKQFYNLQKQEINKIKNDIKINDSGKIASFTFGFGALIGLYLYIFNILSGGISILIAGMVYFVGLYISAIKNREIKDYNALIEEKISEIYKQKYRYEQLFTRRKQYASALEEYNLWEKRKKQEHWMSLNGREFEIEMAAYFRQKGYHVEICRQGGDGGIDLLLKDRNGIITAVQCKAHKKPIPPGVARDLYGTMTSKKIPKGIIASLMGGTSGTVEFCKKNSIKLMDINDFIRN